MTFSFFTFTFFSLSEERMKPDGVQQYPEALSETPAHSDSRGDGRIGQFAG
jgi:hypothetical protein